MSDDLLTEVRAGLKKRAPAELRDIAEAVDGISFSWLSKLARGKYTSEPSYRRLRAVAEFMRAHPPAAARAVRETRAA